MTATLPAKVGHAGDDLEIILEPEPSNESEPVEPPTERAPRVRLPHVRALDGLRGVAVLAVVVYHLDDGVLPGGFLGVSVFFTLSGFLITNLLLTEWGSSHTVGLRNFWGRRFRRLLPAALLGLALALALSWFWADASQLENLRADVLAALGYVANWRFIFSGDLYGAGFEDPSPVLHYWSLAIEEQFYVVVALIAFALARWARRKRTWVITFGSLAVLSMLSTVLVGGGVDTNRVYFGSDTRAFELLAGVLLALAIGFELPARIRGARGRHLVVSVAAVGILVAFLLANTSQRWLYRGGLWVVALGTVLLIVGALDRGPVNRALSWKPLVALGLISYGVYVYHWPIFLFVTSDRTGLDGISLVALRLAITLVLSVASYLLLEQPIRQRRFHVGPAAAGAVLAAVASVLLLGTTVLDGEAGTRGIVDTPDLELSMPIAASTPSLSAVDETQLLPPVRRVLFLGDSLVHQSWPTFNARLASAGIEARAIGGPGQHLLTNNGAWSAALERELATFDADVVVLEACCGWGTPWKAEQVVAADGRQLLPDTDESWAEWSQRAAAVTDLARNQGRVVLWVLAPPAQTGGYYGPIEGRIEIANAIYRGLAACRPGVGLVDWRVLAAPDGSFTWDLPDRSGNPVRVRDEDGLHFSPEGQAVLADHTMQAVRTQWALVGGRGPAPPATCGGS
jgi:peptidoglycan/LPS O-acetylase OafA/YrhL/lysophospholipase L1-like esterase